MKNVHVLYEPQEIRDYLRKKWKTDLFRREQDKEGSLIHGIVERAAKYPLFVYEFSDHPTAATPDKDKTEWAHFGAWLGGVTDRDYASGAIHDAYWLHELHHKGFMTYAPDLTFEGWKDKMFRNELNASMASELELYFHHPEFRKQTFEHEIFADRYLQDPEFMQRWKADPPGTRDEVRLARRELMLRENKADAVEYWIHKFAQQNEGWASIWSRRYDQVESKMHELHRAIDSGANRKEAMDRYMAWLQSPEITQGTEIPFPDEAEAFAGVYRLNNRHYQQSVAHGDMKKGAVISYQGVDYSGGDARQLHAGPVATAIHGPLPHWSARQGYQVSPGTGLYPGNFAVIYAAAPEVRGARKRKAEMFVVIQKRGDKGLNGEDRFGVFGGYASVDDNPAKNRKKEQPPEACARGIREESTDDKGRPVLNPDPRRLTEVLAHGYDYRQDPATSYTGYALELTPQELAAIRIHSERTQNDGVYAKAVTEASKGEVAQILVMPLSEALALGKEQFTHPHEFEAIEKLAAKLKYQQKTPASHRHG